VYVYGRTCRRPEWNSYQPSVGDVLAKRASAIADRVSAQDGARRASRRATSVTTAAACTGSTTMLVANLTYLPPNPTSVRRHAQAPVLHTWRLCATRACVLFMFVVLVHAVLVLSPRRRRLLSTPPPLRRRLLRGAPTPSLSLHLVEVRLGAAPRRRAVRGGARGRI